MDYVTHKKDDGSYQLLKDHLVNVAERAKAFADAFGAGDAAYRMGLLHDIGKYSVNAQRRQRDPEHCARVDHSTAGAQEAFNKRDAAAAFAIAGHHAGLPNIGAKREPENGTLLCRCRKQLTGADDPSDWRNEIAPEAAVRQPDFAMQSKFELSVYTRMLFSCLVDADFLDTEAFLNPNDLRGAGEPIRALYAKMRKEADGLLSASNPSPINAKRNDILRRCLQGGEMPRGLYTLTVPTGGGKTKASLAFALSHAAAHDLRRVIYVVPYTGIIEQNAGVFSDMLGEDNVLEHHANVVFQDGEDGDSLQMRRWMLACENWDAPVVVTTAVQFFESLFAAKTSKCRKLHNIADSVIVFDEAQMLPLPYIKPCVDAVAELVRHYGVTAVLCTATQPALNRFFKAFDPQLEMRELMPEPDDLYRFFRRVRFEKEGAVDAQTVAQKMSEQGQALCIVNTRAKAKEVYEALQGEGRFCLTTLLTPRDRTEKLKEIRQRLKDGRRCLVVATCLIEAGVDVDFPTVWREVCGLDSVLQAAGRCNRENTRRAEESIVHIFSFEGAKPRQFAQNIASFQSVAERFDEIDTLEAIKAYYTDLFLLKGEDALDARKIIETCKDMNFRTAAENFRMIDDETFTVYIPTEENEALLNELRMGKCGRQLLRKLAHDAVSIYPQQFQRIAVAAERLPEINAAILTDRSLYDEECGLRDQPATGIAQFA